MQASSHWSPPGGVLAALLEDAEARAAALERRRGELAARIAETLPGRSLAAALRREDVALIAEVKRRSPSRGVLAGELDVAARAHAYARAGAAALSILTQPSHFGGALEDLTAAAGAVPLPLLRKDFIVNALQLLEARAFGASAVLLIARALAPEQLARLVRIAEREGLETLIEVRSESEMELAITLGPTMIGVNTRNLETLEIDPGEGERLLPLVPDSMPAIYESGVADRSDVERAARCGADAVLVGSALSTAPDPTEAARGLTGVLRRGRRGR